MKALYALSAFLLITFLTTAQRKDFEFTSTALSETQNVWVQLPEDYSDTTEYGVLYVLDADGHFAYMTNYVSYLSKSFANVIPKMIVVGVRSKSPIYRYKNFTPRSDNQAVERGGADQFLTFLCNELVPEINRRYKTTSTRVLAGHSLAGLVTVYTMIKRPEVFTHAIAASPSIGYSNGVMLTEYLPQNKHNLKNQRFYFSVADTDMKDYKTNTDAFRSLLEKTEWKGWTHEVIVDTDHYSTCPAAFYKGLITVFKK
jgi:predicted alpha/beta superfamily hydrolase